MTQDMTAENSPQEHENQQQLAQGFSEHPVRLATESPSFSSQSEEYLKTTNVLETRLDSGTTKQPNNFQGSSPTPDRPKPIRHGGKNLLIAGGAAVASTAVIVGGFLGIDKVRNSSQNPDVEPSGFGAPAHTVEPVSTINPTETATPLPTATITPEATPTPVVVKIPDVEPKSIEKYPYELGYKKTYGNVTLAITKEMQNRTECFDTFGGGMKPCPSMQEVFLKSDPTNDGYLDAEQRLNDGVMFGLYKGWLNSEKGNKSVLFDDFKSGVKNGKDFTFTTKGQNGSSQPQFAENITVDPRRPVTIVFVSQPSYFGSKQKDTNYEPAVGFQWGYRSVKEDLYIQIFDITAAQVNSQEKTYKPKRFQASLDVADALTTLNIPEWTKALGRQGIYLPSISQMNDLNILQSDLAGYFFPERSAVGHVNGIIGVK